MNHEQEKKKYCVEGHVKVNFNDGAEKLTPDGPVKLTEVLTCYADYGPYDTLEEAMDVARFVINPSGVQGTYIMIPYEAVVCSIENGVKTEIMTVVRDTQSEERLGWEDLFEAEGASE